MRVDVARLMCISSVQGAGMWLVGQFPVMRRQQHGLQHDGSAASCGDPAGSGRASGVGIIRAEETEWRFIKP